MFQTHIVAPAFALHQYALTPDGGFIVNSLKPGAPLTIITGRHDLLQK